RPDARAAALRLTAREPRGAHPRGPHAPPAVGVTAVAVVCLVELLALRDGPGVTLRRVARWLRRDVRRPARRRRDLAEAAVLSLARDEREHHARQRGHPAHGCSTRGTA